MGGFKKREELVKRMEVVKFAEFVKSWRRGWSL